MPFVPRTYLWWYSVGLELRLSLEKRDFTWKMLRATWWMGKFVSALNDARIRGVTIPTLDPEPERFGNSGCQFNGTKKGPIRPKKGPAMEK